MFKEILTDTNINHFEIKPIFQVTEKYIIKCTPTEALRHLTELQIRKNEETYNPTTDDQISTLNQFLEKAVKKTDLLSNKEELSIMGELWESTTGLANTIINNFNEKSKNWQVRSWFTNLLTGNFVPQEQLEKASRLNLTDKETDAYILRESLQRWKSG